MPARYPGALLPRFRPAPLSSLSGFRPPLQQPRRRDQNRCIRGWLNGADHSGQLQTVDFAAFQLFIQQFRRFGHAQGQRFVANVFHHHRHAFRADWYAIPPPIMPAPVTAACFGVSTSLVNFFAFALTYWSFRKIPTSARASLVWASGTKLLFSSTRLLHDQDVRRLQWFSPR